jgi:hypothetical protein
VVLEVVELVVLAMIHQELLEQLIQVVVVEVFLLHLMVQMDLLEDQEL